MMVSSRVGFAIPLLLLAGVLAGCSGGGHSLPPTPVSPTSFATPPLAPQMQVPPRPSFIDTVPKAPSGSMVAGRRAPLSTHPSFFNGEQYLGSGTYYLT